MPESRKNGPEMTRIRIPAVPEEKRKERKGQKEAAKEGNTPYLFFPTVCFPARALLWLLYGRVAQARLD